MGVSCVLALIVTMPSSAAPPFGGGKTDAGAQLTKLFGANRQFTATAEMSVKNKAGKETHATSMEYAVLDGKIRTDMDLAKMQPDGKASSEGMEQMKQMGMSQITAIVLPEKKITYMIYPGLKAYVETPIPEAKAKADEKVPDVVKTELGKDTVDGHPCVKYKVVVTDARNQPQEMTVWEATDLKNFPIQSQVQDGGNVMTTKFTNLKFEKPAVSQFEVPSGFHKYGSMNELMMGAMQKMMPNSE
jgi:hypothetical protein